MLFIALTILIAIKNVALFLLPPSVHTEFNYMCVCGGESKGLCLCSVMSAVPVPSNNLLGILDEFRFSGVLVV
jgi:hypothetical protein